MTYSNKAIRNPSLSASHSPAQTPQTHAAYIAAVSPAVTAVITQLLLCLMAVFSGANSPGSGRALRSAKGAAAISALVMIMVFLPGTYAQKKALIESHFANAAARAQKLFKAYLIWRQRKCWMWGGGFMAGALTALPDVFIPARDHTSFDALIPN